MSHDLITPAHDRRQMVRRELENLPWAVEAKAWNNFVAKVGIAVIVLLLPPSIYSYCTRPSVQSSAIVNMPAPGAEAGAGMGFSK